MLIELVSVSTRKITPSEFVLMSDFSSFSLITKPLLMFQAHKFTVFLSDFLLVPDVFCLGLIRIGTGSTGFGFPIGAGSGFLAVVQLG